MKLFRNIRQSIKLSSRIKQDMWNNISDMIAIEEENLAQNVRTESSSRHRDGAVETTPSTLSSNRKKMVIATKIIAGVLVTSMAGASAGAEFSVPGDMLYGMKVGFNESIRGAFAVGAEQDAQWEIEKLERRAKEQAQLESSARLTLEMQTEIQSRVQSSAQKTRAFIATIRAQGDVETAATLEAALTMHLSAFERQDTIDNMDDSDDDVRIDVNTKTHSDTSSDASIRIDADIPDIHINTDTDTDVDISLPILDISTGSTSTIDTEKKSLIDISLDAETSSEMPSSDADVDTSSGVEIELDLSEADTVMIHTDADVDTQTDFDISDDVIDFESETKGGLKIDLR